VCQHPVFISPDVKYHLNVGKRLDPDRAKAHIGAAWFLKARTATEDEMGTWTGMTQLGPKATTAPATVGGEGCSKMSLASAGKAEQPV